MTSETMAHQTGTVALVPTMGEAYEAGWRAGRSCAERLTSYVGPELPFLSSQALERTWRVGFEDGSRDARTMSQVR